MFPVCKMMAVPHRGMKDFKLIEVNVLEVKMKILEERLQSKTATANDVYAIMEPTGKKVFNFIEKISKEFSKQVYGYKSKKTEAGIIVTSVYVPVLDFAYKTKGEKRCFTESLSELLHSWTTAGIEHFQLKDDELSIYEIEVKAALFENGGWITIFKSWDEPRLSGTAAFLSEFLLHSSVVQVQTHPTKVGKLGMDVYFTFDVTTSNGVLPIDVYYLTKDLEQWSKMDFRSIKLYDFSGRDNKEVPFPVCINVPEPDESVHVFNATVFSVKITATEITTMTILSDKMDVYSMLDPYCYEMLQLLETVHMQFRQNVMGCRTNQVKTEGYWLFSIYVNESKLHLENANEQLCTQDSLTAMIVKWKRKTSVRFSVPLENIDITTEKIVGFLTKKGQKFEKNEQWTSERVAAVNKFLLQWSNGTKTKYPVIHVTVNTESLKYLYANVYQVFDVTQTGPINFDEYLKDLRAWANKYSEALKISGFRKEVENIKMFTICEQMAVPDAGKNTFKLIETNVIEIKMKQPTEIIHTANTADGDLWGKLEPVGRTILSFVPSISSEFAKHIYGYKTQQTASGSLKIWFYIPAFASVYKTNGSINCSDRSLSKLLHHWKSVTVRHFSLQEHEMTISATTKKRHLQRLFVNAILSEKIGSVISLEDWEASGANEVTTFLSPFLSDPLSDYTFVKVETTPENYNYLRMEMYVTLDVTAPNGALPVAIESFGQDLRKWSEMYQGAIKLADFKGEIEGLDRDPEEIFPECLFVSQMAEVDSQDLDSDRTGNPYLNPGGLKLLPPSEVNDAALIEKDSTDGNAGWRLVNHFQTPLFTLFSMSMTMLIVLN
ncbi:hypothetical protein D915_000867 [Fasciola hepatica]|uniref:Uncharacterized protein n=1 Tax=Fasciola hepatica TaxID=6192 RepID=A0A4E0RHV7_FASHE|nr:hypothetical protein D915_000867 [Fasciola hepatica]